MYQRPRSTLLLGKESRGEEMLPYGRGDASDEIKTHKYLVEARRARLIHEARRNRAVRGERLLQRLIGQTDRRFRPA